MLPHPGRARDCSLPTTATGRSLISPSSNSTTTSRYHPNRCSYPKALEVSKAQIPRDTRSKATNPEETLTSGASLKSKRKDPIGCTRSNAVPERPSMYKTRSNRSRYLSWRRRSNPNACRNIWKSYARIGTKTMWMRSTVLAISIGSTLHTTTQSIASTSITLTKTNAVYASCRWLVSNFRVRIFFRSLLSSSDSTYIHILLIFLLLIWTDIWKPIAQHCHIVWYLAVSLG